MADKSPHAQHSAKKSGKALKAKRTARRTQHDATAQVEKLLHPQPRTR
jgi:hypothetical protein